ncbi:MAG: Mov34/MPN/PAD-1 family protein [Acidimicrobiia bacterium]
MPAADLEPPTELRLTAAQRALIIEHCVVGYPDEACGLLSGPLHNGHGTGLITGVHPARNADASARSYTVDSRDLLTAMRAADAASGDLVGVWHSHTHTEPYPSTTDIRQAFEPSWLYVLVGLAAAAPVVRAYRILGGVVHEVPVVLDEGVNA